MGETNLGGGAPAAPLIHVVDPGAGGSVREAEAEGRERTEKAEKYLEAQKQQLELANREITSTVLNRIRETLRTQYKLQASEIEQLLSRYFPEAAPPTRSTEPTTRLPPTDPSHHTATPPATKAPVNAGAETGRTDSQPGTTAGGEDNQAFALQQREGLRNVASGKAHLLAANLEGRPIGSSIPVPSRPPDSATPPPPQMVAVRLPPPSPPRSRTGPDGQPLVAHPSRGTLASKVPATPSLASADPSALPVNPTTPEGLPPTPGSPVLPRGEVKQFALGPKAPPGAATSEQEVENLTLAARLGVLQNGGPTVAQVSPPPANARNASGLLAAKQETVAERGKGDTGKTEGKGDKGGLDGAFALGLRRQAQYIPA